MGWELPASVHTGIIVARTAGGVIGLDGKLPWKHRGDLRRFRELTLNTTVVMGRLTFESIGSKPLPERRNLVLTRQVLPETECFRTMQEALLTCQGMVWFIGGARVFAEALEFCERIDLTHVPDVIDVPGAVRFPPLPEGAFEAGALTPHPYNPRLQVQLFWRSGSAAAGTPRCA